jgi:hypothetical protein
MAVTIYVNGDQYEVNAEFETAKNWVKSLGAKWHAPTKTWTFNGNLNQLDLASKDAKISLSPAPGSGDAPRIGYDEFAAERHVISQDEMAETVESKEWAMREYIANARLREGLDDLQAKFSIPQTIRENLSKEIRSFGLTPNNVRFGVKNHQLAKAILALVEQYDADMDSSKPIPAFVEQAPKELDDEAKKFLGI